MAEPIRIDQLDLVAAQDDHLIPTMLEGTTSAINVGAIRAPAVAGLASKSDKAANLADLADAAAARVNLGLGNVTNTSDANKPVSTAQQAALSGKSNTGHTHTPGEVGLGNVNNTADAAKPVSTAQQTALNLKLDAAAYSAADVLAKIKGVDGSGSGLDADLLRNVTPGIYGLATLAAATTFGFLNLAGIAVGQYSIADDAALIVALPTANLGSVVLIIPNGQGQFAGIVYVRANAGSPDTTKLGGGVNFAAGLSSSSGTTGADNFVTAGVSASGNFFIENRSGAGKNFTVICIPAT